jgi:hypothetical protein
LAVKNVATNRCGHFAHRSILFFFRNFSFEDLYKENFKNEKREKMRRLLKPEQAAGNTR